MGFLKVFSIVFLCAVFAKSKPLRKVIAKIDTIGDMLGNVTEQMDRMRHQCEAETDSFNECFQIGKDNLELQKYLMVKIQQVGNITKELPKLEKQIKSKLRLLVRNFILPGITSTMNEIFENFQNKTCARP